MEAIQATEISEVKGYKMQPCVLTEETTGLRITLRHFPIRVYMYIQGEMSRVDDIEMKLLIETALYTAFGVQQVEGLKEPPVMITQEIEGVKYTRLDESTLAQFTPGFLIELKRNIMAYNHLTREEMKKLNFIIA